MLILFACYVQLYIALSSFAVVRVEFVKDRYMVEATDTRSAIVCLTKTGTVDFDVTVEAFPEEITEGSFLEEGEELAKGRVILATCKFMIHNT